MAAARCHRIPPCGVHLPRNRPGLVPKPADQPRGDWRAHANFGQLAAFWLQVHTSLRHEGSEVSRIVDAFEIGNPVQTSFSEPSSHGLNGFLQHLDEHHRIEDGAYFPKFRQLDERLVIGFDPLETDHELIYERLLRRSSTHGG